MNINPIKQIYRFNKEAGLLNKGYDDRRESAYPIEEMLETFVDSEGKLSELEDDLPSELNDVLTTLTPKQASRMIMGTIAQPNKPTEVDILDKHLDSIIFNFGSIFKLGLTPQQAMRALELVMNANMTKLKAGQDSEGKQMKPSNFVGPEEKLQHLLNERT